MADGLTSMGIRTGDPLWGISDTEQMIMARLLQMPPEPQKAAPKPASKQAKMQQRRRQDERQPGTG